MTTAPVLQPNYYPLELYRGDTAGWQFVLWADAGRTQPVDLTGAVAAAQIRPSPDNVDAVDLACVISLPNKIDVTVEPAVSAAAATGSWDLQVTYPTGNVVTVVAGKVTVTADVTRVP